jgi:hypothetical protein
MSNAHDTYKAKVSANVLLLSLAGAKSIPSRCTMILVPTVVNPRNLVPALVPSMLKVLAWQYPGDLLLAQVSL